ncbi:MAG TPA: histidine kinase [Streptosporangiaceae bacterium]|nr:histidine kinase [Streptosporangiaceae bacterium]
MTSAAELIARTLGVQQTIPQILVASTRISRQILGADSTFMAVADGTGDYPMSITDGIRDIRFREITVRPAAGLGGQVLLHGRPHRVADYICDPTISRDFVYFVCDVEGLRGMACVPVNGPDRVEALLYTATRIAGPPADQTLQMLELVAAQAELSLQQAAAREQAVELAMLRDRQRLATELHDSVAQMLFTIGVAARYARQHDDPAALGAALEEIESTAAQARRELRASLRRLSQPSQGVAFEARLAGEARLFERTTGCRVVITGRGERRDVPQLVEDLLIDTALEGLRNAVKYEGAQIAIVHLAYEPDAVVLVLQAGTQVVRQPDSGATRLAGTGAGLWMMRQRVAQLRGTLELTRDQDGQTVLRVELPTRLSRQSAR